MIAEFIRSYISFSYIGHAFFFIDDLFCAEILKMSEQLIKFVI